MHFTLKIKTIIALFVMAFSLFFKYACNVNFIKLNNVVSTNISLIKYSNMIYGDIYSLFKSNVSVQTVGISVYSIKGHQEYIDVFLTSDKVYSPIEGLVIETDKRSITIEGINGYVYKIYNLEKNNTYLYKYIRKENLIACASKIDNLFYYNIEIINSDVDILVTINYVCDYEKI